MDKCSDIQFKVFDWLRFPLIVGVVFIHCFGKPFDYNALNFSHLSGVDCYNLFRVSISKVLTHVCVPTFYLISGYLFFIGMEKWNTGLYIVKIKRRCKSLLIPFLIWNTIALVIPLVGAFRNSGVLGINAFLEEHGYMHLYWDCIQWNLDRVNWLGGGTNISSSPYLVPLWFLRDLIVVVLCSPLFYYVFKKIKAYGLLLLMACYMSGVFINKPGFSSMAFLFFGAGAYSRMNNIDVTNLTYRYRKVLYVLAFVLWIICSLLNGHETSAGDIVYPFYVITGFLALLNISTYIVNKGMLKIPQICSKSAFFIYLLHTILIINIVANLANRLFGEFNIFLMTVSYLFVPIVTVVVCLAIYCFLNRFAPSICKVLTGNR